MSESALRFPRLALIFFPTNIYKNGRAEVKKNGKTSRYVEIQNFLLNEKLILRNSPMLHSNMRLLFYHSYSTIVH